MFAARPGPPGVLPVGPPQISSIFPGGRTLLRKREGRFPAVSRGSAPPQGGGAPPMPPHPSLVASWGLVSGALGSEARAVAHGQEGSGAATPGLGTVPPSTEGRGRCVLADGRSTGSARRGRIPGESAASARTPPQPPASGTRSRTAPARSGRGQEAEELSCLPERRELPPAPRRGQSRLRWGRSLVVGSV